MTTVFILGPPPSSSSSGSKVINKVPKGIIGTVSTALPVGMEALLRLGGKTKESALKKGSANDFPEEKIVYDYTFYHDYFFLLF